MASPPTATGLVAKRRGQEEFVIVITVPQEAAHVQGNSFLGSGSAFFGAAMASSAFFQTGEVLPQRGMAASREGVPA